MTGSLDDRIRLSRSFSVCVLSYGLLIALPYRHWFAPRLGPTSGLLAILAVLGAWLACVGKYAVARPVRAASPALGRRDALVLGAFAGGVILLQLRWLRMPVEYGGDEDFHVMRVWALEAAFARATRGHAGQVALWALLAVGASWIATRSFARWGAVLGFAVLVLSIWLGGFLLLDGDGGWLEGSLSRYPPLATVVHGLFANRVLGTRFCEWAYRVGALLPMFGFMVWPYLVLRAHGRGVIEAATILPPLALAPLIYFFSGLLHIEPVLLVIQGVVFYRLFVRSRSVESRFELAMSAAPLGVAKEIAPAFLAAVAVVLALEAWRAPGSRGSRALEGARLVGVLLFPAIPCQAIHRLSGLRPYPLRLSNFTSPLVLDAYGDVLWAQLGLPFVILALAGLVSLGRSRRHLDVLGVAGLSILFHGVLFTCDHLSYVGYRRYMLLFLPPCLAGLTAWLLTVRRGPVARACFLATLTIGGIAVLPWRAEDRTQWGCPRMISSNYYFPFDRACQALADEHRRGSFLVAGLEAPYLPLRFYLARFGLERRYVHVSLLEVRTIDEAASVAHRLEVRIVLFVRMPSADPMVEPRGATLLDRFVLSGRRIDLYEVARDAR